MIDCFLYQGTTTGVRPLVGLKTEIKESRHKRVIFVFSCEIPNFEEVPSAWTYLRSIGFRTWGQSGNIRTSIRTGAKGAISPFSIPSDIRVDFVDDVSKLCLTVDITGNDYSQYRQLENALELWTLYQVVESGMPPSIEVEAVWSELHSRLRRAVLSKDFNTILSRRLNDEWMDKVRSLFPGWEPKPPRLGLRIE